MIVGNFLNYILLIFFRHGSRPECLEQLELTFQRFILELFVFKLC